MRFISSRHWWNCWKPVRATMRLSGFFKWHFDIEFGINPHIEENKWICGRICWPGCLGQSFRTLVKLRNRTLPLRCIALRMGRMGKNCGLYSNQGPCPGLQIFVKPKSKKGISEVNLQFKISSSVVPVLSDLAEGLKTIARTLETTQNSDKEWIRFTLNKTPPSTNIHSMPPQTKSKLKRFATLRCIINCWALRNGFMQYALDLTEGPLRHMKFIFENKLFTG